MKKGFIALACVFLLAGCSLGDSKDKKTKKEDQTSQKEEKSTRMEPKKAVEALINAVVYEKDLDQLEAAFNVKASDLEGLIESSFVSGFMKNTDNAEEIEKQAHELWVALAKQVKEKATYEVTVVKSDVRKPVLKVDVKGIDMHSLDKVLQERLLKEVNADPSIADDDAALTAFVFNVYREELANVKASDTAMSFEITLSPDSLNKKLWTFDDSDDTFSNMLATFFFSSITEDNKDVDDSK